MTKNHTNGKSKKIKYYTKKSGTWERMKSKKYNPKPEVGYWKK